MQFSRWARRGSGGLVVGTVAASVLGLAAPALAASGPVSTHPASGTPALAPTGTTEQVRQLVQCGGTMYAVGSFTSIQQGGTTFSRHNAFSFSATAPYKVTSWNPNVNGKVNTVAFNGTGCNNAYLGGKFSSVHGGSARNLAEVSTSTGAINSAFAHNANGQVETLLANRGHLLTGGYFTSVNGSSSHKYLASLNVTTGKDDGFVHLGISGTYNNSPATRAYNQQLSHSKDFELVEGVFTSVGGQHRQQIFMLNLTGSSAAVTGWTSPEFNGECVDVEAFYLRAASWSPDDGTVYIATTGFHPLGGSTGGPRTGLCDAAAAFPATQASVGHKWINYTGCDSLFSTAADTNTAYFGGHERWFDNPDGCNAAGPGAVSAPGMAGLSPSRGAIVWNPTRSRGLGADDMLVTGAGLWVASDNAFGSSKCGGVGGHAGICFLPYG
jgi:hypothetical protein